MATFLLTILSTKANESAAHCNLISTHLDHQLIRGGTMATTKTSSKKTTRRSSKKVKQLVNYTWQGDAYVLDLNRDRVYRNWMAIETHIGVSIIGAYKASLSA